MATTVGQVTANVTARTVEFEQGMKRAGTSLQTFKIESRGMGDMLVKSVSAEKIIGGIKAVGALTRSTIAAIRGDLAGVQAGIEALPFGIGEAARQGHEVGNQIRDWIFGVDKFEEGLKRSQKQAEKMLSAWEGMVKLQAAGEADKTFVERQGGNEFAKRKWSAWDEYEKSLAQADAAYKAIDDAGNISQADRLLAQAQYMERVAAAAEKMQAVMRAADRDERQARLQSDWANAAKWNQEALDAQREWQEAYQSFVDEASQANLHSVMQQFNDDTAKAVSLWESVRTPIEALTDALAEVDRLQRSVPEMDAEIFDRKRSALINEFTRDQRKNVGAFGAIRSRFETPGWNQTDVVSPKLDEMIKNLREINRKTSASETSWRAAPGLGEN